MIARDLGPEVIDDILEHGPIDDLRLLPIALSMDPPEGVDVERICLNLAFHKDGWVRANALTAFGHLARVLRKLDHQGRIKQIVQAALRDEDANVCAKAGDAIADIKHFLGWSFQDSTPAPHPRVPRSLSTTACYRLYLLVDEASHILVERSASSADGFAPDPRGLAQGSDWRLPGFSLTDALSDAAQTLEALWAMRHAKIWANESNRFEEIAVVRANIAGKARVHRYGDWVELRCRAYFVSGRTDHPYAPAEGVDHRWISPAELMSDAPMSAHDRYMLALFNDYAAREMGSGAPFIENSVQ